MNIPEILPCPFCGNVPPPFNCKRGRVICGTEDCPIAGHSIEVESWNRRQPTPEAAIPEGYKLVPIKPTEEMFAAAEREWDGRISARAAGVWSAMLTASPCRVPSHWTNIKLDTQPPKPEPTEAAAEACKCGKMPSHIYEDKYGDWRIHCSGCRNGTIGGTREACIRRWNSGQYNNSRAAPKPPAEWMEAAAREIMQGELKSVTTPWSVNTTASDEVVAKGIASIIAKHAPKVPEGWQMVPVEPTRDMRDSGGREFLEARDRTSTTEWDDAAIIYKAMIAAAPKGEA